MAGKHPAGNRNGGKRIALVTGGNRGIGYEICHQLARKGLTVVLSSRSIAAGRVAARRLQAEGLDVEAQRLDVTRPSSIRAAVRAVNKRHGRIDVLVNNAGILADAHGARVIGSNPVVFRKTLDTNFHGPLLLVQAVAPLMLAAGYGRIVNMSSGLGQLQSMGAGTPAYRISKTALNALTATLAAEVRGKGVLVNALCPGWVRTRMGGSQAARSVAQGADTAVWLATLPQRGPSGGFFRNRKRLSW
jgi:NAD(P)-dependent dehydrogenase (short-subunit alcohol dehydrogenase family)